jgi:hypothetical protein
VIESTHLEKVENNIKFISLYNIKLYIRMKKLIFVILITFVFSGSLYAQLSGNGTIGNTYTGTISTPTQWYPDLHPNRTIYCSNITIASGGSLSVSPGQYYGGHVQFTGTTTLTINSGGSFTLNPQTSITVHRLVNNGTITLESSPNESGVASILHRNYSGNGTTITRLYLSGGTTPEGDFKWHYIAVPIENINVSNFATQDFAQYIESLVINENNESGWVASDGFQYSSETDIGIEFSTLELGKGYNYYSSGGSTLSLTGNLNISDVDFPVTCGSGYPDYQGFNLVGNPFASCLDWDYIINNYTPASINNAIYFTNNGKFPAYVNGVGVNGGTGTIPPLQGFFVHATSPSSVYFPIEARTHNLDQYRYKKGCDEVQEKKDTISLVRIKLETANDSTDFVVRFNKKASFMYDNKFDAYKFSKTAGDFSIWTTTGDIDYSINGLPFPDSKVEIPVGIKVTKTGTYKLSSNEIKLLENYSVTLRDLSTNSSFDLKKGEELTFEAPAGITENRFILSIANLTTEISPITAPEKKFSIYSSNGTLNVLSLSDEFGSLPGAVTVYDLTGRKVLQVNNLEWNGNGDLKQFGMNPAEKGLFIIEVKAGNKKYIEKVNINRKHSAKYMLP